MHAKQPFTVREINARIRDCGSRYVYILENGTTPHRIVSAKTIRGAVWVRILSTDGWVPVNPNDTFEVR